MTSDSPPRPRRRVVVPLDDGARTLVHPTATARPPEPDRVTTRSMGAVRPSEDSNAPPSTGPYAYAAIRIVELLRRPLTASTRAKDERAVEAILREIFQPKG